MIDGGHLGGREGHDEAGFPVDPLVSRRSRHPLGENPHDRQAETDAADQQRLVSLMDEPLEFRYEVCDGELCDSAIVTIGVTAPLPLPPIDDPLPVANLPQLSTETASPPLNAKPAISPSIGLNLASSASLESLSVLLLPLTMLGVVMVWVLSANNFPFLFFWRRKRKAEEPQPIA